MEKYTDEEAARRWQDVSAAWYMQDLLGDDDEDGSLVSPGYDQIIASFAQVIVSADIGSYSGDTIALLHRAHTCPWGFLKFGWGSCSGCDALQGARTLDDLRQLWVGLYTSIEWRTTAEMQQFLREHDFAADFYSHFEDARKFVEELMQRFKVDPATATTRWEE